MLSVLRESDCGIVFMHMKGSPQTMQDDPTYDDVVEEVSAYLRGRRDALRFVDPRAVTEPVPIDPPISTGWPTAAGCGWCTATSPTA